MIENPKELATTIGGLITGVLVLAIGGVAGKALYQVAPLLAIPVGIGFIIYFFLKKFQKNTNKCRITTSAILSSFAAFSSLFLLISDYAYYDTYITCSLFFWYTLLHSNLSTISVLMFAILGGLVSISNIGYLENNQTFAFWLATNTSRLTLIILTIYELKKNNFLKSSIESFPENMKGWRSIISSSFFTACFIFSVVYFDGSLRVRDKADPTIGLILVLIFIPGCIYFYIASKLISTSNEGIKRLSLALYSLGAILGSILFYMNNGYGDIFKDFISMQIISMMVGGLFVSTLTIFIAKIYYWVESGFKQN